MKNKWDRKVQSYPQSFYLLELEEWEKTSESGPPPFFSPDLNFVLNTEHIEGNFLQGMQWL